MIKSPWVWIHEKLTTGVHGVGAGTVGIMNKDITIQDADGDTKIQVEEGADEDKIRMDVAGVEAFLLSAVGIQTLAKQAGCAVRQTDVQVIPDNTYTLADFDTEDSDIQSEFNSRRLTGQADANELNKLHDADGGFEAGDVGATVWNTDDETYGIVTAFVDSGELTLGSDVCPDGNENYVLYHSIFTTKEAGNYLVIGHGQLKQLLNTQFFNTNIYKNGALWLSGGIYSSGDATYPDVYANDIITLAANDTIKIYYKHNHGSNRETYVTTKRCTLGIQKVS